MSLVWEERRKRRNYKERGRNKKGAKGGKLKSGKGGRFKVQPKGPPGPPPTAGGTKSKSLLSIEVQKMLCVAVAYVVKECMVMQFHSKNIKIIMLNSPRSKNEANKRKYP